MDYMAIFVALHIARAGKKVLRFEIQVLGVRIYIMTTNKNLGFVTKTRLA